MFKLSKSLYWTAAIVGALFLVQYWVEFLMLFADGDPWGHKNYWGGDVGTYLILAILLAATPAYLFAVWRYWPGLGAKPKVEDRDQGVAGRNLE